MGSALLRALITLEPLHGTVAIQFSFSSGHKDPHSSLLFFLFFYNFFVIIRCSMAFLVTPMGTLNNYIPLHASVDSFDRH